MTESIDNCEKGKTSKGTVCRRKKLFFCNFKALIYQKIYMFKIYFHSKQLLKCLCSNPKGLTAGSWTSFWLKMCVFTEEAKCLNKREVNFPAIQPFWSFQNHFNASLTCNSENIAGVFPILQTFFALYTLDLVGAISCKKCKQSLTNLSETAS